MFAITGLGVVSPLAGSAPALWAAVREGRSAISPLGESLGGGVGAMFAEEPASGVSKRLTAAMDPIARYACAAAEQALEQAQPRAPAERIGAVIGVGIGGIVTTDQSYLRLYGEQRKVDALAIPKIMPSAAASNVSMAFGLKGPCYVVSSACASSAHAIVEGMNWLRTGGADVMLVGGAEAPFAHGLMMAWKAMHIMAPDTCRPFSAQRKGMVMGEGAACLVMERLEDAQARGAEVLAVLAGGAVTADADHLVKPNRESITRAMQLALQNAGIGPGDVDYVNAHGTGTQVNDETESGAILDVFGDVRLPVVSSTKAATGHTMGAAGVMEAVITVGALREGFVPPTLNFLAPDPACALDICPNATRAAALEVALSNSFAFGGLNVSLVIRRGG